MVGVAQLVEPRIVIPVVVGSSPIVHPSHADVAKLVDALDLGSSGKPWEFESPRPHQIIILQRLKLSHYHL